MIFCSIPLRVLAPDDSGWISRTQDVLGVAMFVSVIPAVLLGALAASILARGLIDPRLALQRLTLWTLLGVAVTFVFVLVERTVALRLAHWLSLGPETGALVGGAAVAVTFVPIRRAAERWVTRFVERRMPVRLDAVGSRRLGALAVARLTGPGASAADEQLVLIATAQLHQAANRAADAHAGRASPFGTDAVLLTFDEAGQALAAMRELQAAPDGDGPARTASLGLQIGLHWGEYFEQKGGSVLGRAANLTAGLAARSTPDSAMLASGEFVRAAGAEGIDTRAEGPQHLEDLGVTFEAYALH